MVSTPRTWEGGKTGRALALPNGQPCFQILGLRVAAIQIPDVIEQMKEWIAGREQCHSVAFTGLHGVSESSKHSEFKDILKSTDLVVADGMPLVWLGRLQGHPLRRRVYGPELMETFCRETQSQFRHFFYGGAPGIAENLARTLEERFHIVVAGTYCPPFRELTEEEDNAAVERVQQASPDVLWVGLSTPKQERWMHQHRARLRVPVLLGVGAAFDICSGNIRQAPAWMRENGLEWLFRLWVEPRRLWKRYLVAIPGVLWRISFEIVGLKRFE